MSLSYRYRAFCTCLLFGLLALTTFSLYLPVYWRPPVFEWGASLLALLTLMPALFQRRLRLTSGLVPFFLCVVWGALQLAFHWTVYPYLTQRSILQGFALFCVFWTAQYLLEEPRFRYRFLEGALWFAVLVALAHVAAQRLPPDVASRYFAGLPEQRDKFGILSSYNSFAQFLEIFLPIALWRASRGREPAWPYWLVSVWFVLCVIYVNSRMGIAMILLEFGVGVVLSLPRSQRRRLLPALAVAALAISLGAGYLIHLRRGLTEPGAPLGNRGDMTLAALSIFRDHPLTGIGLGNFSTVHPAYARFDLGQFVNFAHDDAAQALSEGGLVFVTLLAWLFVPFLRRFPAAPWALGLAVLFIHSCADYPFHITTIAAWAVTVLATVQQPEPDSLAV